MNITSGDWIAIAMGSAASLRWALDIFKDWAGDRHRDDVADEEALRALRSEFNVHVAEDRVMYQWIKDAIDRIERNIASLQRQLGLAMSHQPEKVYELSRKKAGGEDV